MKSGAGDVLKIINEPLCGAHQSLLAGMVDTVGVRKMDQAK